ncbi:hypothetical protein [Parahaliea mediterranea]|uniref:Uncharacterized protein n=1 Tax=Parahaliea mediterranea TaxID=651086 RepID=A0A939IKS5_9GAMM|nr:hypothetical protein [Parahaliea mediterranea]MBN7797641.1 hypothetical protein [Parahaliea mediterranea]
MPVAVRLVTYVDIDEKRYQQENISLSARHELELADGSRVLLLDDRGWGGSAKWHDVPIKEVEESSRMVAGPDDPPENRSRDQMETDHWARLEQIAREQGANVDAVNLRSLKHDVVFSQRLRVRFELESDCGGSS